MDDDLETSPGFDRLTPKIIIDLIVAGAEVRLLSGQLTAQEAEDAAYEMARLKALDQDCPENLWAFIAAAHRLGQIDPTMSIARRKAALAQVKLANEARRADGIQEIIERHSGDLWARKPSLRGNNQRTASEIRIAVKSDLMGLQNLPKGWNPAESTDSDSSTKKEIDRIARRVGRIGAADD